jgi:hypothetical protein
LALLPGPSQLNPLQPIGEISLELNQLETLIENNPPSQSSKTSSNSEYYLSHVFCEGNCISRITTPRDNLDNRNIVDLGGEIIIYENPIGLDDVDEYHSTNGEQVLEINTLVPPIIKGCWNCIHQPFLPIK